MNLKQFVQFFASDPTNLTLKGKVLSIISGGFAIFIVAFITREYSLGVAYPIIVSSIGASAALLFIVPHSPLAQPWPLIGGQLVSAFVGMACAIYIPDAALASGCAVSASFLAMLLLRCLHPPGASTALAPIMGGAPLIAIGYDFVWQPVAINVAVILIMSLILNRWLLRIDYPVATTPKETKTKNLSHQDIKHALKAMNTFIDVTENDLMQLLTHAETYRFERLNNAFSCADIMDKTVLTVNAKTTIEKAWRLMYSKQLKAMPVVDKSHHVIGIITWSDFFKFINLSPYESVAEKFLRFIRRRPNKVTQKPKLVGDIMSTAVTTLLEQSHIDDLIALMSIQGYRQIPIINNDQRLVGIICQTHLITTLYKLHGSTSNS